jgi:hypothetical protein
MTAQGPDEAATANQERWRAVRSLLKENRHQFATTAATL